MQKNSYCFSITKSMGDCTEFSGIQKLWTVNCLFCFNKYIKYYALKHTWRNSKEPTLAHMTPLNLLDERV